jgi:hypothetical protein
LPASAVRLDPSPSTTQNTTQKHTQHLHSTSAVTPVVKSRETKFEPGGSPGDVAITNHGPGHQQQPSLRDLAHHYHYHHEWTYGPFLADYYGADQTLGAADDSWYGKAWYPPKFENPVTVEPSAGLEVHLGLNTDGPFSTDVAHGPYDGDWLMLGDDPSLGDDDNLPAPETGKHVSFKE